MMTNVVHEKATKCKYIAWLCCLYVLLERARTKGMLAIEDDIDDPYAPESIFNLFPFTLEQPYLDIAVSMLDLRIDGYDLEHINMYQQEVLLGYQLNQPKTFIQQVWQRLTGNYSDERIIRMICVAVYASEKGCRGQFIAEQIRQLIPYKHKPSNKEMKAILSELKARIEPDKTCEDISTFATSFVESLTAKNKSFDMLDELK